MSSFVKASLDKALSSFNGLRRCALTNGPLRKFLAASTAAASSEGRLDELKPMIARVRQFGKKLSGAA
ncbi:MAG: hypothetical protein ACLPGW_13150 [Roseiarcus sp.]